MNIKEVKEKFAKTCKNSCFFENLYKFESLKALFYIFRPREYDKDDIL